MPKGVIWAGAVDGSSQVGAMVTCQAITTSLAPRGWAVAGAATASSRAPASAAAASRERPVLRGPEDVNAAKAARRARMVVSRAAGLVDGGATISDERAQCGPPPRPAQARGPAAGRHRAAVRPGAA